MAYRVNGIESPKQMMKTKRKNPFKESISVAIVAVTAIACTGCFACSPQRTDKQPKSAGNHEVPPPARSPEELLEIAQAGKTAIERAKAIEALPLGQYDKDLSVIVKADPFGIVRQAAARKLVDQTVCVDVALHEREPYVRVEAIRKVRDQNVLETLSKDPSELVRRAAEEQLKSK